MKTALLALVLLASTASAQVSTYGGTVGSTVGGTNLTITGNATVGGTISVTGADTAASYSGAGTGLTGTAASLTAGKATALAAAGTTAASGNVCLGVDASGNCIPATVNATTSGVAASTSPWSAGAAATTDALNAKLAGAVFTGQTTFGAAPTISTFTASGSLALASAAVFTSSGPAYFNVQVATQAAGAAGASVTVNCPANTFVMYGGCNCTSTAVGTTTIIFNGPSGTWTAGASGTTQTGWKCQSADVTTGQTCAAFVQCASIRN